MYFGPTEHLVVTNDVYANVVIKTILVSREVLTFRLGCDDALKAEVEHGLGGKPGVGVWFSRSGWQDGRESYGAVEPLQSSSTLRQKYSPSRANQRRNNYFNDTARWAQLRAFSVVKNNCHALVPFDAHRRLLVHRIMTLWARGVCRSRACRLARFFSADAAAHPSNKTQVYLSRCHDPLLNLSVEHRLLQITPPESTVLVLYVNGPCVVFGRNQNPWLELNLHRLAQIANTTTTTTQPDEGKGEGEAAAAAAWHDSVVKLVRRRSGGGTVFHDLGNVNFSVILPTAQFDRDRHADMVVRALQSLGRVRTRVNERHDIVVDSGSDAATTAAAARDSSSGSSSSARETATTTTTTKTFKISGSAYKLTRFRALHHGTCLLQSPNLASISGLLRSPAEPFIKARGVDSVRSPVTNVGLDTLVFQDAVVRQFAQMYGPADIYADFDDSARQDYHVQKGYDELAARDWIYGQTPRFAFRTYACEDDPRPRPQLPFDHRLHFEARHGLIEQFHVSQSRDFDARQCVGASLQDVHDWRAHLHRAGMHSSDARQVGAWMNHVLGAEFLRIQSPATMQSR
ncbi:Biotin/lipoate A/B protein ligase [Moelleriella libera RCEF 2490]|uniref:Putative lipoate-protein ligase A n=1 Tax=Moelleriella libera RCEF 2490 TaxID=1081109 RepID=A0A168E8J1_9HYPO|nr:Biotin/lipoate A/B protein ligase [Moelleriella libera RCEF 2490]